MSLVFCLLDFSAWGDEDAIIDIDNHVATFTGTWGTNNTPILFYGDDFRWAACSGSTSITAEATFSSANVRSDGSAIYPAISGEYAVYVRWVVHPNRTTNAKYRIYDGSTYRGACVTTMNQQLRGGEWVYCNTVPLTAGNAAVVKLGNDCESGKYVIADAVRFVRVSKDRDDIVDEPGGSYFHSTTFYTISSTSSSSPTQIISKSITCPSDGYVLAMATGQPNMWPTSPNSPAWLTFSLSTSTTWDNNNNQASGGYFVTTDNTNYRSLTIMRRDSCSSGQTLTYYLLSYRSTATDPNSYIWQPTLALTYYPSQY